MIDTGLRNLMVNDAGVLAEFATAADAERVAQNKLSRLDPRIWYQRRARQEDLDLGGTGGITETSFDLEVIATDIETAMSIADAVKDALHGYQGPMGTAYAQMTSVEDVDDDYFPKGIDDEEQGLNVVAFDIRIFHATG